MGFEKVIHRMATDSSFAERISLDPKATLEDAKFNISIEEFNALDSVINKLSGLNLSSLGKPRLYEWYSAQIYEWYSAQLYEWY